MTPRQFAAIMGALLLLAGVAVLAIVPVSGDYIAPLFGEQSVNCGTALVSDVDRYSGEPLAACRDSMSTRRAWGWPVFLVGVVVLAGAVFVRVAPAGRAEEERQS